MVEPAAVNLAEIWYFSRILRPQRHGYCYVFVDSLEVPAEQYGRSFNRRASSDFSDTRLRSD